MGHKLNFAISGCGNIAMRHALAASNFGNLIAVCDADIGKASKLAEQFNCKAYGSLSDMLLAQKDTNVVSICTPNYLHAQQSIESLQRGFHVLCEKPMAINITDAEEMVATSKKTGKELFIVKQLRYYPHLVFIKNIIEKGLLGKIYSFHINCFGTGADAYYQDWKGSKQKDGGTLYTQFSHYIDLLLWLFGNVKQVQFTGSNLAHPRIEFEDVGILTLKMEDGSIGGVNYTVNAYEKNAENSMTVFAKNGNLKLTGQMLDEFEYFDVKNVKLPPDLVVNTHKAQSHFTVYENVVKALNGDGHSALKAEESIASIQLIDRIYNLQHLWKKILHIVGNRPHFIKLAMLYRQLESDGSMVQEIVHTGQHSSEEMSGVFFKEFQLPQPHHILKLANTTNAEIFIAETSAALQHLFQAHPDSIVFTYGDTNTTLAAAIAAKRTGRALHHFEAGIRTGDFTMPEELNRVITDRLANVNYCCTQFNYEALQAEGGDNSISNKIVLTGDLMYDAYLKTEAIDENYGEKDFVASTIHRLANITDKANLESIVDALNAIHQEMPVLMPLHPHTKKKMEEFNIHPQFQILAPLSFRQMKGFLQRSSFIITDSGGVSREAYFSNTKSLIISPTLFWPEIGHEGCALNTLPEKINILNSFEQLKVLQCNFNNQIFGDGNAAAKICTVLKQEAAL